MRGGPHAIPGVHAEPRPLDRGVTSRLEEGLDRDEGRARGKRGPTSHPCVPRTEQDTPAQENLCFVLYGFVTRSEGTAGTRFAPSSRAKWPSEPKGKGCC